MTTRAPEQAARAAGSGARMWHNLSRVTPERYRQVNALADVASQMTPDRRAAFLDEVCGSDRELREQIEALIAAESGASAYLEKPLLEELAGDMLARPERELTGRRTENYEVVSRLGANMVRAMLGTFAVVVH